MKDKIRVIKEYREITKVGLKEALDAINAYEDGDTSNKDKIELAIKNVESGISKAESPSTVTRKAIRNRLYNIRNMVDELISDCEGYFDGVDKESLDNIVDDALTIRDRFISRLEEEMYKEAKEAK